MQGHIIHPVHYDKIDNEACIWYYVGEAIRSMPDFIDRHVTHMARVPLGATKCLVLRSYLSSMALEISFSTPKSPTLLLPQPARQYDPHHL